ESTYIVKSAQGEGDYLVEHTNDNVFNLGYDCEAFMRSSTTCNHIFAVSRNDVTNIQRENERSDELNGNNDQWVERLIMLRRKID
ncbi:10040_t:CDS:2, partial [Dentiscutata erythropus]